MVHEYQYIFDTSDFYEKYASETNELILKLESAKQNVKNLYDRWEELEQLKKSIL